MLEVAEGLVFFLDFFRAAIASGLVTAGAGVHLRAVHELLRAVAVHIADSEACSLQPDSLPAALSRGECGCEIYLTLLSFKLATCMRLYSSTPRRRLVGECATLPLAVTSATPRADPRIYRSSCSLAQSTRRLVGQKGNVQNSAFKLLAFVRALPR